MENSYLFYDLETSGLNKAFDQVQQYAAKRLDQDFNLAAEHYLEARVSADVLPSPYATITHRISLNEDSIRATEYAVVKAIHSHLNQPGSISLGYNTLGFDDEFLRFAFHRNLLPPYTHQYAQNCMRMDVYPMTVFYYLYRPQSLIWPQGAQGVSFKLEDLAMANDWQSGRAHHAMHDVDATIALAAKLRQQDPKMWAYLQGYFNKKIDHERIAKLEKIQIGTQHYPLGLMVGGRIGRAANFQAPCLGLGQHHRYQNQQLWLRLDHPCLLKEPIESWFDLGAVVRKKLAEPNFFLPLQPKYTQRMPAEHHERMQASLQYLQQHPQDLENLAESARAWTYPEVAGVDIDADLYQARFASPAELKACTQFHMSAATQRAELIQSWECTRLRQRALRCLWRTNPEVLPAQLVGEIKSYVQSLAQQSTAPVDFKGQSRLTADVALQQIKQVRDPSNEGNALDNEQKQLLCQLEQLILSRNTLLVTS